MRTATTAPGRPRIKHYGEYALLRVLLGVLRHLPLRVSLWCARRLGDVAFDLLRLRRRVTLENLHRAFGGELGDAERRRVARRTYRNFGISFVEFALFASQHVEQLAARVRLRGAEHLCAAAASGRGVIYLTAHAGSWEILGATLGFHDRPLGVVVGDQHNPLVDRFAKQMRRRVGMIVIPTGSALRRCIRLLREGGRLGIVGDQDAGADGLFLDFCGAAASTPVGPARFAYRTGAAVVFCFDRYVAPGEHEIVLHPPVYTDPRQPEDVEIRRLMERYNRVLERFVRRHPEAWFWMHRRWKTPPPQRCQPSTHGVVEQESDT
ncbi:MAG: hypothetical protein GF330_03250 [Candidatus Eisenbacteria bacterium]|nr:hypothetical protein [Candidatus Eisenbacteria bacterium]